MSGPMKGTRPSTVAVVNQDRISDPPAGVREGPVGERQPEDDQHQDDQVDGQVEAVVGDSEQGEGHGSGQV